MAALRWIISTLNFSVSSRQRSFPPSPGHPNISRTLLFHLQTQCRTARCQRHFVRTQERSDTPDVQRVIKVKEQLEKTLQRKHFFLGLFFPILTAEPKAVHCFCACVCVFWTTLFITHLSQYRSRVFCVLSLKAVIPRWVLLTQRLQIPRRQYLIPKGELVEREP